MNVRTIEKVLVIVAILGSSLLALNIQVGSVLLTLSMGSLTIMYFIASRSFNKSTPAFIKRLVEVKEPDFPIVPNLVFGYVFSVSIIAILYTINGYPGSETMLFFGMIGMLIGFGFTYFKHRNKTLEFLQPCFGKMLLISVILMAFILIPKQDIRNFFHSNTPIENVLDDVN